jgi:hypothetical protein
MIKEECHSFIHFIWLSGCDGSCPHWWCSGETEMGTSVGLGIRWPGPVICHCHVILSLSSPAVLLAALGNWCLLGNPDAGHPPYIFTCRFCFSFFFSVRTNRRRRQLSTLQPCCRSRYTTLDSIWAVHWHVNCKLSTDCTSV